ncbi:hypothetical protein KSD_50530 [Ktedonobacter sp. SOSP1-85]|uniref:hypothetical protein n=1 Tax=Ktedonobacter sp. SOSP1-85 TaxID=2778367 RepID=UPI001914F291|nr:hypothetical protein [Ktedonobacter sp. SOSP1-85]GHO77282.1 hypothetical protein KSD_50530 [Ktedonobacter sp. SOSP1-85]
MRYSQVEKRTSPRNRWQPPPRRQERLLSTLTGSVVVQEYLHTQSEDAMLVSLHEKRKGVLIPLLTRLDKLSVILLGLGEGNAQERPHLAV